MKPQTIQDLHLLTVMAAFAVLGGCSEDPAGPGSGPRLLGNWEIVEAELTPINKDAVSDLVDSIRFGRSLLSIDEERIWILNERGLGFRTEVVLDYVRDGKTLEFLGDAYRVEIRSDELVLNGPLGRIRMLRRKSIPAPEAWIREYISTDTRNTAFQSEGDLAWDGTDLWISGGPPGKEIIRIDSESGTAFPVDVENIAPVAIEQFRATMFANDGDERDLYAISPTSGGISDEPLTEFGSHLRALISDGTFLWCVSLGSGKIHLYSPDLDAEIGAVPFGDGVLPGGGSYHDGILYIAALGIITEFQIVRDEDDFPVDIVPVGAIELPGHEILGVAHDGEALWVNAHDVEHDAMRLHRIIPIADGAG